MATAISRIAFQDAGRAAHTLARVATLLPPGLQDALPNLLAETPDPDSALNFLERLSVETGGEVLRLMDRNRYLLHYAIAVFGYSPWLGDTLLQNPDLLHALQRDRNLERSHSRDDYQENLARFRSRTLETDLAQLLARFKRREYIRIMLRDVLGIATLAETTAEISALSDVLIEEALRECDAVLRGRFGPPQRTDGHGRVVDTPLAVLALGKLGGNELNYSSDVDLMFLYGDGESEAPAAISNREYFIRLAQNITETLSKPTREGSVFRIDLRLRPQGREGETAVALSHALRYYRQHAQDWELQALIKARHAAGDVFLAREFIRQTQPQVYRGQINFSAIETALDTREKIQRRRRVGRGGVDVKLDRGGIRDIEFLVQCLQRVYGGAEPWLRSGGTLFSLHKLHDKQHLDGKDFHDLNSGYAFLRRVEHRLQLRRGQQVHRLPESDQELQVLERALVERREQEARLPVVDSLRARMAAVADIYARIIHSQQPPGETGSGFRLRSQPAQAGREQSYDQILHRLATDEPALYEVATRRELSTHARRNLHRFLAAAFTSSERYAAVVRDPRAVEHALRLFSTSEYLTDILIRHPGEIATIAGIADQPSASAVDAALLAEAAVTPENTDAVFRHISDADAPHNERLALLRQHYRHRVFAAGARDLLEFRPVYTSLEEMTEVADAAIVTAAAIVEGADRLAILALGRLGSREFDVASDADLLFVRDEASEPAAARKAAEQVVEALAAYTREGTVFAVDPRLRPRGNEGELVSTPSGLAAYFNSEAQPWEALTYTKLRFVAGSAELGHRACLAVQEQLRRFAADPLFPQQVSEMRTRLETSDARTNFKTAPGGFYDVDFVVSHLVVRNAAFDVDGNIRDKLYALEERGLLDVNSCATLDSAAELLRTLEHVVRLVLGRPRKSLPVAEQARLTTERLTARFLGRELPGGLEAELARSANSVRQVYVQVLGLAAPAL